MKLAICGNFNWIFVGFLLSNMTFILADYKYTDIKLDSGMMEN